MAHNQYQYQQALSKQGIKLATCQSCCSTSFPIVEYRPGNRYAFIARMAAEQ